MLLNGGTLNGARPLTIEMMTRSARPILPVAADPQATDRSNPWNQSRRPAPRGQIATIFQPSVLG
jgi:hypothetical protein